MRSATLYQDLLSGSYDCVDHIFVNAYFRMGHDPGGFRIWWQALTGSDETLENTYLMRMAGRFSRRIPGYAKAQSAATTTMAARIAAPENVPEPSSVASPCLLRLIALRPNPSSFSRFLISAACCCGPCGVVGDAPASSKRSGKSTGLWGKLG
jgi:hypothetical protein